jgi:trehalose 6-phosphate phosphatase
VVRRAVCGQVRAVVLSRMEMMLPHAETLVNQWRAARERAGLMLLALDFDGTLAPIVRRPEDARPLPGAVAAIERIRQDPRMRVAIVSGRGLEDARARVGVADLYFAGNHGLEIEGPGVRREHAEALAARPALERCAERIRARIGGIEGVQIEDKGLTLSIHFRRVADAAAGEAAAREAVDACAGEPLVRVTSGKMVVEVRPAVDWHKGRATEFLIETLLGDVPGAPAIFIGDDRTDEDAFRVVAGRGGGVVVADPPDADTAAIARVRSPEEVVSLLEALA